MVGVLNMFDIHPWDLLDFIVICILSHIPLYSYILIENISLSQPDT